MSRNYAQFTTSIWRPEDDFGDLTWQAQWAYFMLGTQPDISAAGVLSLNVRRWSKRARNVTREFVIEALQELQSANKVHYDYDTEELLIRTFVKADGGYGNRKRRPVIERAALELESPRLRGILAEELRKLGDAVMASLADRLSAPYGIAYAAERPENVSPTSPTAQPPPSTESDESTFPQVDSLSDSLSDSAYRFDGVVVTKGLEVVPQPSTHNPQPQPSAAPPQSALSGMPEPPTKTPTDSDRAFGLARGWIETRKQRGTPVVARGKTKPLHALRNLLLPFAENGYTDAEIETALNDIGESIPSAAVMDRALTRIRTPDRNGQGRRNGSLASSSRTSGAATGANLYRDPPERKPFIVGVVASEVTAQAGAS